ALPLLAKVILFCGMTVGLGLSVLGGISVLLRPREAETMLRLGGPLTTAIAIACLLVPTAYVVLAARVRKPLAVWSVSLALPQWRLALAQGIIGTVHFTFVAGCRYPTLLAIAALPCLPVAPACVLANVATLISHVPGGLGVIETVVLLVLGKPETIGALIAFRFLYFLVPLALGGTLFLITEAMLRGKTREAGR